MHSVIRMRGKRLSKNAIPQMTIGNEKIEHAHSYKYLGVMLDATLSWNEHVDNMCKKLRQRVGVLSRLRQYLNQNVGLQLYNALVMPIFIIVRLYTEIAVIPLL